MIHRRMVLICCTGNQNINGTMIHSIVYVHEYAGICEAGYCILGAN